MGLYRRYKPTNPDYADSFGQEKVRTRLGIVWDIVGKVNEIWGGLRDRLHEILMANDARLQPPKSLHNAKKPHYILRCYMIGPDKEHAWPHVAILSENEHLRTEAQRIVLQHGILEDIGWGRAFLRIKCEITMTMDSETSRSVESRDNRPEVFVVDEATAERYNQFQVSSVETEIPSSPFGMGIRITASEMEPRFATVGGLLKVNGTKYGKSMAHVFREDVFCESADTFTLEFVEEDLDIFFPDLMLSSRVETSSGENSNDDSLQVTSGVQTANFKRYQSSTAGESFYSRPKDEGPILGHLKLLSALDNQNNPSSLDLGYALISLDASKLWDYKALSYQDSNGSNYSVAICAIAKSIPKAGAQIFFATGARGVVDGTSIESFSVLKLGHLSNALCVWTVSFSSVQKGDCGSWAFNLSTGELLGMLVATCAALDEAYIIPARDIVKDLESQDGINSICLPEDCQLEQKLTRLYELASDGDAKAIDALLSTGANPNERSIETLTTALYRAAHSGDFEMVERLVAEGDDINRGLKTVGIPALYAAAMSGHTEAMKQLIAAGADVNERETIDISKPLHAAIKSGDARMVLILVKAGADRDEIAISSSITALREASEKGEVQSVSILLDAGANIQAKTETQAESARKIEQLYPNKRISDILLEARESDKMLTEEEKIKEGKSVTALHKRSHKGDAV